MSKHYGIPYMGSKDKIAPQLCEYMLSRHPEKQYFIDACCGGLAMSNYVYLKSDLKILANDLDANVIDFYKCECKKDLIEKYGYQWVDRETYKKICNSQHGAIIAFMVSVWTFGNKTGTLTYLFGVDIELQKELLHNLLVWGDETHLTPYFYKHCNERERELNIIREWYKTIPDDIKQLDYKKFPQKRIYFMQYWKEFAKNMKLDKRLQQMQNLQQLERVGNLERLDRLQNLERLDQLQELERLEAIGTLSNLKKGKRLSFYNLDCINFLNSLPKEILDNAIVYIDPPYKNTATYKEGQEDLHQKIVDWAISHKDICPTYVSEYSALEGLKTCRYEYKVKTLSSVSEHRTISKELLLYNDYSEVNEQLGDLLGLWEN